MTRRTETHAAFIYLNDAVRAEETQTQFDTDKLDAHIIADLLDDELETLVDQLEHEDRYGEASEPCHESTVLALELAGLVTTAGTEGEIDLTPRGRRIARRLASERDCLYSGGSQAGRAWLQGYRS